MIQKILSKKNKSEPLPFVVSELTMHPCKDNANYLEVILPFEIPRRDPAIYGLEPDVTCRDIIVQLACYFLHSRNVEFAFLKPTKDYGSRLEQHSIVVDKTVFFTYLEDFKVVLGLLDSVGGVIEDHILNSTQEFETVYPCFSDTYLRGLTLLGDLPLEDNQLQSMLETLLENICTVQTKLILNEKFYIDTSFSLV